MAKMAFAASTPMQCFVLLGYLLHFAQTIPDSSFIWPGKGYPPDEEIQAVNRTNTTNATNSTDFVPPLNYTANRTGWRPVAHAAYQDVTVPRDGRRQIELLEEFTIPDGESELLLPIEVSPNRLTLEGDAPPLAIAVASPTPDGEYGAGHRINVTVLMTTEVDWRPEGVAVGSRWVGSSIDVPARWIISGSTKHLYGTANDAVGFNAQWTDGAHPTAHTILANATAPVLRLATGCLGARLTACAVPEVQTFTCAADGGALTITWNGHHATNIKAHSDQEELKQRLEAIPGLGRVTVSYSTPLDDPEARRLCTTRGNNVTVTFEDANIPPFHIDAASSSCEQNGNLPELELDQYNAPQDSVSGRALGDGTFLYTNRDDVLDVHGVVLSRQAIELRRGHRAPDRYAPLVAIESDDEDPAVFLSRNRRSRLVFQYTVCEGDSSSDLEYRSVASMEGEGLVDAHTAVPIDLTLPPPGFGGSYRHHGGESLSARRHIRIDTAVPQVVKVTSPLNDGVYGEGDAILIDVVFNKAVDVEVTNGIAYLDKWKEGENSAEMIRVEHEEQPGRPFLYVAVGRISEAVRQAQMMWYPPKETVGQYVYLRKAYFVKQVDEVVTFRYVVNDLDYAVRLDYVDQSSLRLNGGFIRRSSSHPTTHADVTLPPPRSVNSLAGTKSLLIYPLPARVVRVYASGGTQSYGAFEIIKLNVQFGWGLLAGWRGQSFLPPYRALTNRYGVPVTLSTNAAPYLELAVDVVPVARVWSLSNGSSSLVLAQGHGFTNSWALGLEFEVLVGLPGTNFNRKVVTITNTSGDVLYFTPSWNGQEVLSGTPSGNLTSLGVRNATYTGGNNTDTLTFEYLTLPGDRTKFLDYTSSKAFKMSPNSTLLRLAHSPKTAVNTTLVPVGTCSTDLAFGCSLSATVDDEDDDAVDVEARSDASFRPSVIAITTTKVGGVYGVGEPIDVVVSFSAPVMVSSNITAAPVLRMSPGGFATYGYGSGTHSLTFWYVVGEGDSASILDSYALPYANAFDPAISTLSPLDIFFMGHEEGWIRRASSQPLTPALLDVPTPGDPGSLSVLQVTPGSAIEVCTEMCAYIETVSTDTPADSILGAGARLTLLVRFNRRVAVNTTGGTPVLELHLGSTEPIDDGSNQGYGSISGEVQVATYTNVSEDGRTLSFLYTVQATDPYTRPVIVHQRRSDLTRTTAIQLQGGRVVTVATGRNAVLTVRRLSRVLALEELQLDMTTSRSEPGDSDPFSPDPARTLRRLNITIDTSPPTCHTVEALLAPKTKVYGTTFGAGDSFTFALHFTAPVVVRSENGSWPFLALETSSARRSAAAVYTGGSGTSILYFAFESAPGDYTPDLDYPAPDEALLDGIILRDSNNPITAVNRTLPFNGAPGSLGHESPIILDTSPPRAIEVISTLPLDLYSLRTQVQTLELVWAIPPVAVSLTSGPFRIAYTTHASQCLAFNSSALGVQKALRLLGGGSILANVSVTEVPAPHSGSRRLKVDFSATQGGSHPLRVFFNDDACLPWKCTPLATTVAASNSSVLSQDEVDCSVASADVLELRNNDLGPRRFAQGGFVEVTVRYDRPVVVNADPNSPPLLRLNVLKADPHDNLIGHSGDYPNATYAAGALVQTIDVGVFASKPVTEGQFRLRYGSDGPLTGCIDFEAADSAVYAPGGSDAWEVTSEIGGRTEHDLRSRLEELPRAAAAGIISVTARPLGNGTRFRVHFRPSSNPQRLEPVYTGGCQAFIPIDANVTLPPSSDVTFRYELQAMDVALPLRLAPAVRGASWDHARPWPIHLGNSTIRRDAAIPTTNALLDLPTTIITSRPTTSGGAYPTAIELEGASDGILIDCSVGPQVMNVTTASWADAYGVNHWIDFYVTFSSEVVAPPGTALHLATGNVMKPGRAVLLSQEEGTGDLPVPGYVAVEVHGNNTHTLRFHYRVQEGDSTPNLTPLSAAALEGEVVSAHFAQWAFANTDLRWPLINGSVAAANSTNNVSSFEQIDVKAFNYTVDGGALKLDTEQPRVLGVSVDKPNGTYTVGEEIYLLVHFSREVAVAGRAFLKLNTGGVATWERNAGNRQAFLVGADASTAMQHSCCGKFQLSDNSGAATECMQWDLDRSVKRGVHNLPALRANVGLLSPWPEPFEADGVDFHGGFKWRLAFPNGGAQYRPYPKALLPVNGDDECTPLAPPFDGSALVETANTAMLSFRYVVRAGDEAVSLGPAGTDALSLTPFVEGNETQCFETPTNISMLESYVRRDSTRPMQDANLTLPESIFIDNNASSSSGVVVNGTGVRVVDAQCLTGNGPFTEGDTLTIRVLFTGPVWLIKEGTGADIESGIAVTNINDGEGDNSTSVRAPEETMWDAEPQCEGTANAKDALSLALETVRTMPLDEIPGQEHQNATNGNESSALFSEVEGVARARYVNGSGTDELFFTFIVRPYEATYGSLDFANGSALQLQPGYALLSRSTYSSIPADLQLPDRGAVGSLSDDQNVTLYASARAETSVSFVTADVPEGCYDPGTLIHIHVLFDRCVQTPGTLPPGVNLTLDLIIADALPPLVLVAQPDARNRDFARLLVFPWVVGQEEHTLRVVTRESALKLTSSSEALRDARGYAVNMTLAPAGTPGSLDHSVILAVHHGRKRAPPEQILPTPASPRVLAVNTSAEMNTVYGAGNVLLLHVVFDAAVTVHCLSHTDARGAACPSLALRVKGGRAAGVFPEDFEWDYRAGGVYAEDFDWSDASSMAMATYTSGNNTATLSFEYAVRSGDGPVHLDYVDTRPAAKTQRYSRALVLPCEALQGGKCRAATGSSSSIVRSIDPLTNAPPTPPVHAITFLPVPGTPLSLGAFNLTLETSPPVVMKVTTPARDAVYEPTELVSEASYADWGSSIPVEPLTRDAFTGEYAPSHDDRSSAWTVRERIALDVHFSAPVAVNPLPAGCNLELVMDVAVGRFLSTSKAIAGSNGVLRSMVGARRVAEWSGEGNRTNILRLRLPIYPGDYAPLLDYAATPDALGVVCDGPQPETGWVYRLADPFLVTLADLSLPLPGPRPAVVAPTSLVGSGHRVAIQGDSCCRVEALACAVDSQGEDWVDTFENGKLMKRPRTVQGFFTGMAVTIAVRFASPVMVRAPTSVLDPGPVLHLRVASSSFVNGSRYSTQSVNQSSAVDRDFQGPRVPAVEAYMVGGNNTDTLTFEYTVMPGDDAGYLEVTNHSALVSPLGQIVFLASEAQIDGIDAEGRLGPSYGRLSPSFPHDAFAIRPVATRLPTWPATLSLARSCKARVDGSPPHVVAVRLSHMVRSSIQDRYTGGETVPVVVVFSAPVTVEGVASLSLDVLSSSTQGYSVTATNEDLDETSTELTFRYTVLPGHSSPALNYTSSHALTGNLTAKHFSDQSAVLELPVIDHSLPSYDLVVVDTLEPVVDSVNVSEPTCSGVYGAGEEVFVTVSFNHPVVLVPRDGGSWNSSLLDLTPADTANAPNTTLNATLNSTSSNATNATGVTIGSAIKIDSSADAVPPVLTLELDISGRNGNKNATLVRASYAALSHTGTSSLTFTISLELGDGSSRLDYANAMALRVDTFAMDTAASLRLARAPTSHQATVKAENGVGMEEQATSREEFKRWNASLGVGVNLRLPNRGVRGSLGMASQVTVDPPLENRPFIWLVAVDRVGSDYSVYRPPKWLAERAGADLEDLDEDERTAQVYGTQTEIEDEDHTEIGVGDALHLILRFTERVFVHGAPSFALSAGGENGSSTTAHYLAGNGTDELIFEYQVAEGDSDKCLSAVEGALRCGCVAPACRIEGVGRARARPRSFTRGEAGGSPPLAARLRLPLEWPSFTRHAAVFLASYRHTAMGPDAGGGTAPWRHNTSVIVNVTTERFNGSRSDASRLLPAFLDDLPSSTFFVRSEAAPSADLFARFTTMAVRANAYTGEPAEFAQAEGCVRVQTNATSVVKVHTNHTDGVWGVGEHIYIMVLFSGPVMLTEGSLARLRLEVGDTVMDRTQGPANETTPTGDDQGTIIRSIAFADYVAGNNTARMFFRYEVEPGHMTRNLDVDASSCRAVCVAAGIGVENFPFAPYATPAGCHELLANGDATLFANYSQRPPDLPKEFGEYQTFRAASGLEVIGRLVRRAALLLDDVDVALPCPGTRGSLSNHHNLAIDTRAPKVEFVVSLRQPGVYRAGEVIDLQVVFNRPITVTGPANSLRLALNLRSNTNYTSANHNSTSGSGAYSGNGYVAYAEHDPSCVMREEGFSFESRSICFAYTVKHGDVASPFLDYEDQNALETGNGSIFTTATVLTQRALLLLPDHSDSSSESGLLGKGGVEAVQRVSAIQVTLAGLSHDDASDLEIGLEHGGKRATLMDGRLAKRGDLELGPPSREAFTNYRTPAQSPTPLPYASPDENASTSTPVSPEPWASLRHHSGGGSTYHIGDLSGVNLALEGRACQSSTRFGAYASRAVDGDRNPYLVAGESVSHTGFGIDDPLPWWQVSLKRPSPIGTLRVWARQPELLVEEVQYIQVHAHTPLSGTFRLSLARRLSNGSTIDEVSSPISAHAVTSRSDESLWPKPPPPRVYPTSTMDRFNESSKAYCAPTEDCRGDSVQAKIEALLVAAYPKVKAGTLRVHVTRGRKRGTTRGGTTSAVAHSIDHFSPKIDTSELPPSVADIALASSSGSNRDRAVRQASTPGTVPPSQLHWRALQGDYDVAWQVTFIGTMGNMPPLKWADRRHDSSHSSGYVGGLTCLNPHVTTATLREGAFKPAPHGRSDSPAAVATASTNTTLRPGEGAAGPAWLMLFNTTEPPRRGLSLYEARALSIWSTYLDQSAFEPVNSVDDFGGDRGSGGAPRPVVTMRVPGVWARHLRLQRGARSDVDTNEVLARQKVAAKSLAGQVLPLELEVEDPEGSAVKDGGSYVPIGEVRSVDAKGTFKDLNRTMDTSSYSERDFYGFAPLSIAEVEVFEEVHSPLHEYVGSSPLPPTVTSSPLSPAVEPLLSAFGDSPSIGQWTLSVRDRVKSDHGSIAADKRGRSGERDGWSVGKWGRRRRKHGVGTLGRWTLSLTDVLGWKHTFYMDTSLVVTSLPKYGHLFVLSDRNRDSSAELLLPVEGQGEWQSRCDGVDTTHMNGVDVARVYRNCADNFGVGRHKGQRALSGGDAIRRPLRGDANGALVYVPRVGYTGKDAFQFQVDSAGTGLSRARGQDSAVTLRVKDCRRRGGPYFPTAQLEALCACTSPLLFVEPAWRTACFNALQGACGVPLSTTVTAAASTNVSEAPPIDTTLNFTPLENGQCDPTTGICAPGLPDKVISDPRPNTTSWAAAEEVVASGFERMCRACQGSTSFSALRPRCWGEWLNAMESYGIRASGEGILETCEADVRAQGNFNQARCDDDEVGGAFAMGHTQEPGFENRHRAAGRL